MTLVLPISNSADLRKRTITNYTAQTEQHQQRNYNGIVLIPLSSEHLLTRLPWRRRPPRPWAAASAWYPARVSHACDWTSGGETGKRMEEKRVGVTSLGRRPSTRKPVRGFTYSIAGGALPLSPSLCWRDSEGFPPPAMSSWVVARLVFWGAELGGWRGGGGEWRGASEAVRRRGIRGMEAQ